MYAILTGDIIASRSARSSTWQPVLEEFLREHAEPSNEFEISRGDSFQIQVLASQSLALAVQLSALLSAEAGVGVRLGIGIGESENSTKSISKKISEAHIYSGEAFDTLKTERLRIKTKNPNFDETVNVICSFIGILIKTWKPMTAATVCGALQHQELSQKALSAVLQKHETSVSKALKRGGFHQIEQANQLFKKLLETCSL